MQFAKYCEKQLIVVPSISRLLDMKFENDGVFSDRTDIEFELKYSYIHQKHVYQCNWGLIEYAKLI